MPGGWHTGDAQPIRTGMGTAVDLCRLRGEGCGRCCPGAGAISRPLPLLAPTFIPEAPAPGVTDPAVVTGRARSLEYVPPTPQTYAQSKTSQARICPTTGLWPRGDGHRQGRGLPCRREFLAHRFRRSKEKARSCELVNSRAGPEPRTPWVLGGRASQRKTPNPQRLLGPRG